MNRPAWRIRPIADQNSATTHAASSLQRAPGRPGEPLVNVYSALHARADNLAQSARGYVTTSAA
jgi:hypothetical protein